jgi:hypothetical protein
MSSQRGASATHLVDQADLESSGPERPCGFDSHRRHHNLLRFFHSGCRRFGHRIQSPSRKTARWSLERWFDPRQGSGLQPKPARVAEVPGGEAVENRLHDWPIAYQGSQSPVHQGRPQMSWTDRSLAPLRHRATGGLQRASDTHCPGFRHPLSGLGGLRHRLPAQKRGCLCVTDTGCPRKNVDVFASGELEKGGSDLERGNLSSRPCGLTNPDRQSMASGRKRVLHGAEKSRTARQPFPGGRTRA